MIALIIKQDISKFCIYRLNSFLFFLLMFMIVCF